MRKPCWTSRRDRLVCPLCEVGELIPSGQGSARWTSSRQLRQRNNARSPSVHRRSAGLRGEPLVLLQLGLLFLSPQKGAGRGLADANVNRTEGSVTR